MIDQPDPDQCAYCEQRGITDMAQHLVETCPVALLQWGPVGKTNLTAAELTARMEAIDREDAQFKPDGTFKITTPRAPWRGRKYVQDNKYGRNYDRALARAGVAAEG